MHVYTQHLRSLFDECEIQVSVEFRIAGYVWALLQVILLQMLITSYT